MPQFTGPSIWTPLALSALMLTDMLQVNGTSSVYTPPPPTTSTLVTSRCSATSSTVSLSAPLFHREDTTTKPWSIFWKPTPEMSYFRSRKTSCSRLRSASVMRDLLQKLSANHQRTYELGSLQQSPAAAGSLAPASSTTFQLPSGCLRHIVM